MPGCIERIKYSLRIINTARLKQRAFVVSVLDLKNAFGEVNIIF